MAGEQAKLISAAASLIEQMQAKALCHRPDVGKMSEGANRTGLIDSGASSCLRHARGTEPKGLVRKIVVLAQGSAELFVAACGTLVSMQNVETIVALGPLIKPGCRLQWTEGECALWHPTRGRISLDVRSGCPRVSEQLALHLIDEVEKYQVEIMGAAVKAIQPSTADAVAALTRALLQDQEVAPSLGEAVLALWPQVPNDGLLQDLTSWSKQDSGSLYFNRRKRRAVEKAKKVMVHLFAGDSRKEVERLGQAKKYEVLSVGAEEDITFSQTFGYPARLAAAGKVDVWWGAPPCGTNTLCRFIQPGPRPLRGRSQQTRWGLREAEKAKVRHSDELYRRNLLLFQEGNARAMRPSSWNLIENPQDPETYLNDESSLWQEARKHGGFPSFFATKEFQDSAKILNMRVYSGDQGPYGHVRRKPTSWASNKPFPELCRGPGSGMKEPATSGPRG